MCHPRAGKRVVWQRVADTKGMQYNQFKLRTGDPRVKITMETINNFSSGSEMKLPAPLDVGAEVAKWGLIIEPFRDWVYTVYHKTTGEPN